MFGVLEIDGADGKLAVTAAKPRKLLSVLLLRANQWVSDDELRDVVWPSGAPPSATGNLKSYVSQLRRWFGPADIRGDRIERGPGGYRVNLDADELDTSVFEDLVDKANGTLHGGDATGALTHLTEALELWRGEPFSLLDTETALAEVTRLTELRWSAREMLGEALLAADRAGDAVSLLRVMVTEDPLRERGWEHLMAALTQLGRRAEALSTYQRARRVLVDELGVEPGLRLREMHERLLRDEPPRRPAMAPSRETAVTRRKRPRLVIAALGMTIALAAVMIAVFLPSAPESNTATPPTLPDGTHISPRRPVPGIPARGSTKLLFGIGDQANTAMGTELVRETPVGMLTTWFHVPQDIDRFEGWRRELVPGAYAAGYALHLGVASWDNEIVVDTDHGTGCGRPYPLTDDFLQRMHELAGIFAGKADDPPLFVTVFHGVNNYGCARGDYSRDAASTNYYEAIKKRYRQVREIFHKVAPNARVALGWQAWQANYDSPHIGGGRSMFARFADVLRISDFQSVMSWERDSNIHHVRQAVRTLGEYGPVMLAQYADNRVPLPVFENDLRNLLTDSSIAELTDSGLFAWNFNTEKLLNDSPPTYELVKDVVSRNGRPAR